MNEEIYEGTPAKEDVLIGTDSGFNRYRRPDGSTYVHYPYSQMGGATAFVARDHQGKPIRDTNGNLITGSTKEEMEAKRRRYVLDNPFHFNNQITRTWDPSLASTDIETLNAVTGGGLNLVSPTWWGRFAYNTVTGANPGLTGNSGLVPDWFAEKHPWYTLLINGGADAAATGAFASPNIIKNLAWFIKNPRAVKVYHGNKKGITFDLQDAELGSVNNYGIHVSPHKRIAKSFSDQGPGAIMEAYIPHHNVSFYDTWLNNFNHLSNKFVHKAHNHYFGGHDKKWINFLKKHGGKPQVYENDFGQLVYKLPDDVTLPLRDELLGKNLKESVVREADAILKEAELANLDELFLNDAQREVAKGLNAKTAELLSKEGKKVIKYFNKNLEEGGGGISYIVTDPSVFFTPNWTIDKIPTITPGFISGVRESNRLNKN